MNRCFFAVFIFLGYCCAAAQSFEEELKLFGAEDFLLFENATASKSAETVVQVKDSVIKTDSVQNVETHENPEHKTERTAGARRGNMQASSITGATPILPAGGAGQGRPEDTSIVNVKISIFDTAPVSRETSIDFSKSLSQYRNPQKALFYSLLLPGLGQAYNKKYWRTGLYAAVEIGMIAGAVYFRRDAKKIRIDAEKFADDHFEKKRLEKFYSELTKYGKTIPHLDENGEEENVGELIFGYNSGFLDDDTTGVFGYEKYLQEFDLDFYGDRYGVGSAFGVQGWDDATPDYGVDKYKNFYPDTCKRDTKVHIDMRIIIDGKSVFGVSKHQNEYNSMVDYSIKQVQRSSVFVVGIFVNHIASAADAFVSAIINNRKLLKEEDGKSAKVEDVLSRVSIDSGMYLDYDNNLTSKLGLVWRF